jgi:hypothetical protein
VGQPSEDTILSLWGKVVREFERAWPADADYPWPRLDPRPSPHLRRIFPRIVTRMFPLDALATYQGMQPFLDYLTGFTRDELTALLELSEINVDNHRWLIANPGITVIGTLIALYVGVLGLDGAGLHIPEALRDWSVIGGGIATVLLYLLLVGMVGQVLMRARMLRNLLKIAVQDKAAPTRKALDALMDA